MTRLAYLSVSLLSIGCSTYVGPHHPYAPLFNAGGQVDVAVGVGSTWTSVVDFGVRAAVAPIDSLVVTAAASIDPLDTGNGSTHYGAELGVGTFAVSADALRAELIAGTGAGWGSGRYVNEDSSAEIAGPYLRPFAQGAIAGHWGIFTGGAGLRIASTIADIRATVISPGDSPAETGWNALVSFELFGTVRFDIDTLYIDITGGGSAQVGEITVGPLGNVFGALYVGARFQAWGAAPQPPVEPLRVPERDLEPPPTAREAPPRGSDEPGEDPTPTDALADPD
ncbi:MAG: hypothetical protein AB7S26_21005 [Sandaracinaceae bacterium]